MVGGAAGLDRPVRTVRVLLRLRVPDDAAPSTLWVLPLDREAASPRLDTLLLELDRVQAAGVILPAGAAQMSTRLLADRLGLPLAVVETDRLDDAVAAWRRSLEAYALHDLQRLDRLKAHLLDLWPASPSFEAYLADAGRVLGGAVRLDDETADGGPDGAANLVRHRVEIPWGQGQGGPLLVDLPADLAAPAADDLAAYVAALVAMRIDREAAAIESDLRLRGELLLELLLSESLSGSALRAAQRFGMDLGRRHLVVLWDLDDFTAISRRPEMSEARILRLKQDVVACLEGEGRRLFGAVWVLPHSDEFVLIAQADIRSRDRDAGRRAVGTLQASLRKVLGAHGAGGISAGLGFAYAGSVGLRKAFEEAREALMVGVSQFGPSTVTHFQDLGVHRFLYGWVESPRSRALALEFLRPVLEEDARSRAELVRTLRVLLEARGKTAAARELGIHRNSLAYRLSRIESLLHVDLADPNVELVLRLLLRALPESDGTHEN